MDGKLIRGTMSKKFHLNTLKSMAMGAIFAVFISKVFQQK